MMKKAIKYVVLAVFAIIAVVSLILMGSVKINYNISDYLDEKTETKISLEIMETEFGTTGNIQVMVENITLEDAREVMDIIRVIDNVLLVNFNESDPNYFKKDNAADTKGDALFAVIVNGDEYSTTAAEVFDDIKAGLDQKFEGKTNYGGAVVEKIDMRNTMRSEIVIILAIAILFAIGIMLVMAKSWLEPFILLIASGIAVLINMGTNVIFGEISYITNAVAAILQLALSVDYSIVLLHNFRAIRNEYSDKHDAMTKAMKITFKPVLASAATTVAGLLALLFMTMKIGRDIGIVLTKGIAISMFTSLTLFPALLLIFDKLMQKCPKKDLVLSGKQFGKIAIKAGKPILLVALALIIACGGLQLNNKYIFTDSANTNKKIEETFGSSNTVVLVYPHNGHANWDAEKDFVDKLAEFKDSNGNSVLQSYIAYSNTVMEKYTIDMAAEKLGISKSQIKTLFALYHDHNNNPDNRKLDPITFVDFAVEFLTPADGEELKFVDESTLHTLQTLSAIYDIVIGRHTADELYALVSTGAMEGTGLSLFQIRQMYGLYYWNEFDNDAVDFETMLNFMVDMSNDPDFSKLMDNQTIADLTELSNGLIDFKSQMDTTVNMKEFRNFGKEKFGTDWWVEIACDALFGMTPQTKGRAKIVDILRSVDNLSTFVPDESIKSMIKNYIYVYDVIDEDCSYEEFLPLVSKVVLALVDEERPINATNEAVQQAYIKYFDEQGVIPEERINGLNFVNFVNGVIETNETVSQNVGEGKYKLLDVVTVDKFITDVTEYTYEEMTDLLNQLQKDVVSITSSSEQLNKDAIYSLYVAHVAKYEDGMQDPITAIELLNFVDENKDGLLSQYMSEENKAIIEERKQALANVEELFRGDNYNRMLLSINLPNEGADSTAFMSFIIDLVKSEFGPNAHVAGQMVSTYELQETFEKDNQIITIITIISIFLIIAFVFLSISLPVLLVLIIQGAIWIAMSMSLITGEATFFMSYIIATCILMGSTIDYGILMSTNYLGYRKTMNKKDALYAAIKSAMPTIFTSGLILIICGFIVGLVASLRSISTVGFLLGKGTLVSVIMITLVLPSILYVLDYLVVKLTHRKKTKEEKLAKKEAKKAKKAEKKAAKLAKKEAKRAKRNKK